MRRLARWKSSAAAAGGARAEHVAVEGMGHAEAAMAVDAVAVDPSAAHEQGQHVVVDGLSGHLADEVGAGLAEHGQGLQNASGVGGQALDAGRDEVDGATGRGAATLQQTS